MVIRVELDIFSGRPNPTWDLDPDDTQKILEILSTLAPSQFPPAKNDGLGYRGFVLRPDTVIDFDYTTVFRSTVTLQAGDRQKVLYDQGQTIERQLLLSGRAKLTAALYQAIEREINI